MGLYGHALLLMKKTRACQISIQQAYVCMEQQPIWKKNSDETSQIERSIGSTIWQRSLEDDER